MNIALKTYFNKITTYTIIKTNNHVGIHIISPFNTPDTSIVVDIPTETAIVYHPNMAQSEDSTKIKLNDLVPISPTCSIAVSTYRYSIEDKINVIFEEIEDR